ncbi:MAG: ABC transporter permease [Deltaproteobacteria bacterium]|nr:ABC transporter permease [Deltaproteobacteria bacterium]
MWRRIWQIIIKEFIQVWRDKKLRFFLIVPPIVQILSYGYAINFDITNVATAIYDEDRSQESRGLADRFRSNRYFNVSHFIRDQKEMKDLIDRSQVTFVVHLPWDFSQKLKAGHGAPLQFITDATDSNAAQVVNRYAGTILNDYTLDQMQARLRILGVRAKLESPVTLEPRAAYNPNLLSRWSFVPGVIAMVVMLVSLMLTALAVVREREIGTMEQILVTPLRPVEFLLGKTIPFVIISLLEVVMVTLIAVLWFEVPFRGSVVVLFLGTVSFLFNSVGLGLLISTASSTQQQAMMAGTFFLTPAIMMSGLIFPINNMPPFFQYCTYLNPLRYFVIVVQDVFLKGVGLKVLWPQMAALVGLGSAMLALSVLRFRRTLA